MRRVTIDYARSGPSGDSLGIVHYFLDKAFPSRNIRGHGRMRRRCTCRMIRTGKPNNKGQLAQMVERSTKEVAGLSDHRRRRAGRGGRRVHFLVKDDGSILPINFIIALALVKFVPDYLEKQMSRSLGRARVAMIIMMVISILSYAAYIL